jgi:hypothetical protein
MMEIDSGSLKENVSSFGVSMANLKPVPPFEDTRTLSVPDTTSNCETLQLQPHPQAVLVAQAVGLVVLAATSGGSSLSTAVAIRSVAAASGSVQPQPWVDSHWQIGVLEGARQSVHLHPVRVGFGIVSEFPRFLTLLKDCPFPIEHSLRRKES